jgi:hypothetical protein
MGNLRVYDVSKKVNIEKVKVDYPYLTQDPYVKEGFRKKHIVRFNYKQPNIFIYKKNEPLYQSSNINPTHGNLMRIYPDYIPPFLVAFTIHIANIPDNQSILVQAQRITCEPDQKGLPSVEGWHRDGVTRIGILCVDRNNINGGVSEFRMNEAPANILEIQLLPGHFAVFDDDTIMHRVSPITPKDEKTQGYRDVMLFAFPDCSY